MKSRFVKSFLDTAFSVTSVLPKYIGVVGFQECLQIMKTDLLSNPNNPHFDTMGIIAFIEGEDRYRDPEIYNSLTNEIASWRASCPTNPLAVSKICFNELERISLFVTLTNSKNIAESASQMLLYCRNQIDRFLKSLGRGNAFAF